MTHLTPPFRCAFLLAKTHCTCSCRFVPGRLDVSLKLLLQHRDDFIKRKEGPIWDCHTKRQLLFFLLFCLVSIYNNHTTTPSGMSSVHNNTNGGDAELPNGSRQQAGSPSTSPTRSASISLHAAAAVNAGLQHEGSRRAFFLASHYTILYADTCGYQQQQAPLALYPARSPHPPATVGDDPKS